MSTKVKEETKQIIIPTNIDKVIAESLAIETEEAKKAGALGYMARALVQATIPHKRALGNEFVRKNGTFQVNNSGNNIKSHVMFFLKITIDIP